MAIIQVPAGLSVAKQTWGQRRNDVEFRSAFGSQALEGSAPLWKCSMESGLKRPGIWQALIMSLKGRVNQLALWNMGRPQPLGTMRGSMTMAAAAQGATSLVITSAGQSGKTLVAGDYLGVGSGLTQQVVMVLTDAVANGSGVITVATEPPLRNAFASSATVTWYRPCALFRRQESETSWEHSPGVTLGMSLSLLEDYRP